MVKIQEEQFTPDELPPPMDTTLVPKGTYIAQVEECEEKEGQKGPYWNVRCAIIEPPHEGRIVFGGIFFSSNHEVVVGKRYRALKALGYDNYGPGFKGELTASDANGKYVQIRVQHEKDNRPDHAGEVRAKVGDILPVPEGTEITTEEGKIPF